MIGISAEIGLSCGKSRRRRGRGPAQKARDRRGGDGLGRDEAGHRVLDLSDAALHGCDNAGEFNDKPPGRPQWRGGDALNRDSSPSLGRRAEQSFICFVVLSDKHWPPS